MNLKRISKAIAAGVSAGLGAAFVYVQSHSFKIDTETLAGALGAFAAVGFSAAVVTYRAPANRTLA